MDATSDEFHFPHIIVSTDALYLDPHPSSFFLLLLFSGWLQRVPFIFSFAHSLTRDPPPQTSATAFECMLACIPRCVSSYFAE